MSGVGEWFYAFWELSTERRFAGGPIPWTALAAYPVDDDEAEAFRTAIREADRAYLEFLAKPVEERQSMPVAGPQVLRGR